MSELTLSPALPVADSVCSRHPTTKMLTTCSRCGSFVCQECVDLIGDGSLCEPCIQRQVAELPSLKARAKLATWGMYAWIGINAAVTLLLMGLDIERFPGIVLVALGFIEIFVYITEVVLFCRWFHLAVRHALARGHSVGFTPNQAVGSWFIPFINLARPFEIARSLLGWRGRSTDLIAGWQGLWISGLIANRIAMSTKNDVLGNVTTAVLIGAGILCIKVMNQISEEPIERT